MLFQSDVPFPPLTHHYLTVGSKLSLHVPSSTFTNRHFTVLLSHLSDHVLSPLNSDMDAITSSTDTFDSASFPSLTHVTSTTRGPKAEPTEDDFYAEVRYKTYKKLGERGRRAAKTAMDTGVIDEVRIEAGGGGGGGASKQACKRQPVTLPRCRAAPPCGDAGRPTSCAPRR